MCDEKLQIYYKSEEQKEKKQPPEAKLAFEPKSQKLQLKQTSRVGGGSTQGKDTNPVDEVEAPTRFPATASSASPFSLPLN